MYWVGSEEEMWKDLRRGKAMEDNEEEQEGARDFGSRRRGSSLH